MEVECTETVAGLEDRGDFTIHQIYTDGPTKTYVCRECGGDKFIVGEDSYFVAIKCPECGWESCIQNG